MVVASGFCPGAMAFKDFCKIMNSPNEEKARAKINYPFPYTTALFQHAAIAHF